MERGYEPKMGTHIDSYGKCHYYDEVRFLMRNEKHKKSELVKTLLWTWFLFSLGFGKPSRVKRYSYAKDVALTLVVRE